MNRIINCLCHPSKIGLYYKDKMYMIVIHILTFAIMLFGIMALDHFRYPYFGNKPADGVTNLLMNSVDSSDIVYSDNKLTGNGIELEDGDLKIYILKTNFIKEAETLIFSFKDEEVDIYYGTNKLSTYSYSKSTADSFTFNNVIAGDVNSIIEFETLVNGAFDDIDSRFQVMEYVQTVTVILGTYIAIVVFGVIYSLFKNPTIGFKPRVKLCLYCSLIFFILMLFTLLFRISWLQYVAFIMPVIFISITFSHIVRVNVKKS